MKQGIWAVAILALMIAPAVVAADSYGIASSRYELARERFTRAQGLMQACEDNCDQAAYVRSAGNYLSTAADLLHQHLMKLDAYAKSASSESAYDDLHKQIGALDAKVNATRAMTHNLNGVSSREELKNAELSVQESWIEVEIITETVTGRIIDENVGVSIGKLIETDGKLRSLRNDLAGRGVDTQDLDQLLAQFSSDISDAQRAREEAAQVQGEESLAANVNSASDRVLDAIITLREITKELRKLNAGMP